MANIETLPLGAGAAASGRAWQPLQVGVFLSAPTVRFGAAVAESREGIIRTCADGAAYPGNEVMEHKKTSRPGRAQNRVEYWDWCCVVPKPYWVLAL